MRQVLAGTAHVAAQRVEGDTRYQEITYYMCNRGRSIRDEPADLLKSLSEMAGLDWTGENFIGFHNHATNRVIQFIRRGPDQWYAEELISGGRGWDGYFWCAHAESDPVYEVVRRFFEEEPWDRALPWKMGRADKRYWS
ncbi:hypothetical protein IBTHAUMO2_450055 [Nitrosopumilaceae archaeon]|nr:hypothetical protein [Nitrosopumilus sp.]CAI9831849.1 hypothetical protein IBTHAUMO2_450055 [Nitrosopumilaceae archaeon]MDA7943776.1 hypothetical protein [Nitrosopumilus sp.]MDA7945140.1 hypothetical protein [Nitrosopumilus sp.]MDA7955152.1 hypothetical protein [Nitrosopumilus sp.]